MDPIQPLRFGIELECYLPSRYVESGQFEVGDYHRGLQITGAPRGWKAERDASVSPYAPSGYVGLEIVSPVLQGDDGLAQVIGFFDFLKEVGAKVSHKTGMHVHVDGSQLELDDVKEVQEAFRHYELAFYGLNGEGLYERLENPYCCPSELWGGQGRYCSLNVQNYLAGRKKTLECRVWRATTSAEVAVAAVVMFTALVEKVLAFDSPSRVDSPRAKLSCPREASKQFARAYLQGGYSMVDDIAFNDEIADILHAQAEKAGRTLCPTS